MTGCAAFGCCSRSSKKVPGITFHRFPRNEHLKQQWIAAIGKDNFQPSSSNRVCSLHFTPDQFDRTSLQTRLKENVVPSVFTNVPVQIEETENKQCTDTVNDSKSGENLGAMMQSMTINPETTSVDTHTRETRKGNKKTTSQNKKAGVYDEKGIHISSGVDLCDCLDKDCPGCYFPCKKCKSMKCGPECRVDRKYIYEQYEIEGTGLVIKNPLKK